MRSLQAKEKIQNFVSEKTSTTKNVQVQFYPDNPINLTGGQYRTLQEIRAEDTPAYTVTFERVKDFLEGIDIKGDRTGGSHAHIHTPGHNMKILVDIHYGWTNGFGPGTMHNLRDLVVNLGFGDDTYITVNSD